MLLKFLARPLHLQPWPNSHHYGQPRRYIGWQWLAADPAKNLPARYEPKRDGDVVDTDVTSAADVDQLAKCCRDGAFYAADEVTATACGIAFAKYEFSEAGFVLAAAAAESAAVAAAAKPAKPSKE